MLEFAPIAHVIYCRMGTADLRKASIFGGDSYLALGGFFGSFAICRCCHSFPCSFRVSGGLNAVERARACALLRVLLSRRGEELAKGVVESEPKVAQGVGRG